MIAILATPKSLFKTQASPRQFLFNG